MTQQPAPDLELCLLCWVRGEDHNSIFPVKISGTETIGALKKAIRKEMEPDLDDIPAGALKLWKVSASGCRSEPLLSLS
jgi:Crinkler effector protein N-terminal domain